MYEKNIEVTITAQAKTVAASVDAQAKSIDTKVEKGIPIFPEYAGATVFTPSQVEQTIPTQNTILLDNITIKPIPNNYGLITYNGSYITVS